MFDWNDLTHFLAVARHGSTIAAGKALRLSQSTVHRRLSELERRLGHKLVTRHTTGYRLPSMSRRRSRSWSGMWAPPRTMRRASSG
jgi:DNA-binding transcriptional LysR family regulator